MTFTITNFLITVLLFYRLINCIQKLYDFDLMIAFIRDYTRSGRMWVLYHFGVFLQNNPQFDVLLIENP